MINQRQITKLRFSTLVAIKSSNGRQGILSFCDETKTFYRYEENGSTYTANDQSVLITGDGANTRWLGISGKYPEYGNYYHHLVVAKSGALFTTIQSAIDSITDNSSTNRYVITVAPAIYVEEITLKTYVDVIGMGGAIPTVIASDTGTGTIVTGSGSNTFSGFTLTGTTGTAILMAVPSQTMFITDCIVYDVGKGIENSAGTIVVSQFNAISVPTTSIGTFIEITGTGDATLKALGTARGSVITNELVVNGIGCECLVHGALFFASSGTAIYINASLRCNIVDSEIKNSSIGIQMDNAGNVHLGTLEMDSTVIIHLNVLDLNSEIHMNGGELDRTRFLGIPGFTGEKIFFTDQVDDLLVVYSDMTLGRPANGRMFTTGQGKEYTDGMMVLTTDNTATSTTDGGNITDVTTEASSDTGSTFSFQGVTANHTILVGTKKALAIDNLQIQAINILQTVGAVEVTPKSFIIEKWNGTTWEYTPVFSHEVVNHYRYGNSIFLRDNSEEILDFGLLSDWTKKTINGENLYWIRIRIATTVTTAPIFQRFGLLHSFSRFNDSGNQVFNGKAKFEKSIFGGGNIFGSVGGVVSGSVIVGSGATPFSWAQRLYASILNGNGDAVSFQDNIGAGVCTSNSIKVNATLSIKNPSTTSGTITISVLPVEVAGVLVADPSGAIIPTARLLSDTETYISKPANVTTLTVDFSTADTFRTIESDEIDISNYYEGDILLIMIRMTSDGAGSDVNIFSAHITGTQWTHGGLPK